MVRAAAVRSLEKAIEPLRKDVVFPHAGVEARGGVVGARVGVMVMVVAVHAFVLHEHFCHGGRRKAVPVHQIVSRVARCVIASVVPFTSRIQTVGNFPYRLHLRQICGIRVADLPGRGLWKERGDGRKLGDIVGAAGEVDVGSAARPVSKLGCPVFARLRAEVAQIH